MELLDLKADIKETEKQLEEVLGGFFSRNGNMGVEINIKQIIMNYKCVGEKIGGIADLSWIVKSLKYMQTK